METEKIEAFIKKFPIYQYDFISPKEVGTQEAIRELCRESCPNYRKNWACPPAVGKIVNCRQHLDKFTDCFFFSTVSEIHDHENKRVAESLQREHERLTDIIDDYLKENGYITFVLTSNCCKICQKCTFPRDYCLYPDKMHPCIESYGIQISEICEKCSMDYYMGENLAVFFSFIFLKDTGFVFKEEEEPSIE